jgi:alginate O-acetyltransferase complex protein AlgI
MLFSSPDYPLFLIAVFFLYALARWGGPRMWFARVAVMLLLGDLVFVLVAKDLDAVWDPIGGILYRLASTDPRYAEWPPMLIAQWACGGVLVIGAIIGGRRAAPWVASDRGQALIARTIAVALAALGAAMLVAHRANALDDLTWYLVQYGHLLVLAVLGAGIGISLEENQRPLGRVILLFVASALFYHAWAAGMPGPYRYLLALLLSTIVLDYYLGIWIERTDDPTRRKLLLALSLVSNLGVLFFFKYFDFFTHDVLQLSGDRLNLILPAGISFHTFQSLSYTIDVYRRELPATKSVVSFATFVLFFPQLVAGPIVRAHDLLPQLEKPPALDLESATVGLYRIAIGLFKKICIADTLAISIVDRVFEAPERFSSVEVLVGVFAYALQIFCDFSAYSDIAIGSARVLGFTIPENFRTPYRSANLQEFWRRWHISLSTWLRDYVYVALGGNRRGPAMTYVNLTLTMLLGGLWHGASWAFIVWGALHGLGLAITRYFQRASSDLRSRAQMVVVASSISLIGVGVLRTWGDAGTWAKIVVGWLCFTPLWAVTTAWLGRPEKDDRIDAERAAPTRPFLSVWRGPFTAIPEILRVAMCASAITFFAGLRYFETWTWIPLILLTWFLGHLADVFERMSPAATVRMGETLIKRVLDALLSKKSLWAVIWLLRRQVATVLVFLYVCLAWVFFRATSFDGALAVLQQIAKLEFDHANLVPLVTVPLVAGFATHFFADGGYRWLRDRFAALPPIAQGFVLACCGLVLRELAHTKIVPFIYFQF